MKANTVFIATLFLLMFSMQLQANGRLIAFGWDRPTPERIKKELLNFERNTPFTGFVITPTRMTLQKKVIPASHVFSSEQWQWSEFDDALSDLQSIKSATMNQSFLLVSANPGNLDWFDDGVWDRVTQHWRFLARLAKKSGLKGFFVDLEPYYKPYQQFCYVCQDGASTRKFDDYKKIVRQRSFAIMQAVIDEFPNAEVFSTRLLSDLLLVPDDESSMQTYLINHNYGLVPSFIDGWIDAIKERNNSIILIDGNEALSYTFNSEEDFRGGYSLLKMKAPLLLDKANQNSFSKIFRASHGLYLDAYLNDAKNIWFVDRKGSSTKARIAANTFSALNNSDGLVWVYGENGYWWDGMSAKYQSWESKMPDISSFISMVVHGNIYQNSINNMIGGNWRLSQFDEVGTLTHKKESLRLSNVSNGCLVQNKDIVFATDILFSVGVNVKLNKGSASFPYILARWKDINGKWISSQYDVLLSTLSPTRNEDEWGIAGFVRPPSKASSLVILLCVKGQKTENDDIDYYSPFVYEFD